MSARGDFISVALTLKLSECNAAEIIEQVQAGAFACGLLRVPAARADELVFKTLISEPVLAVLPGDHALARQMALAEVVPAAAPAPNVRRPSAVKPGAPVAQRKARPPAYTKAASNTASNTG